MTLLLNFLQTSESIDLFLQATYFFFAVDASLGIELKSELSQLNLETDISKKVSFVYISHCQIWESVVASDALDHFWCTLIRSFHLVFEISLPVSAEYIVEFLGAFAQFIQHV